MTPTKKRKPSTAAKRGPIETVVVALLGAWYHHLPQSYLLADDWKDMLPGDRAFWRKRAKAYLADLRRRS